MAGSIRRIVLLAGLAAPAVIASACGGGGRSRVPAPVGYTGEFRLERYHTFLPAAPPAPFLFADVEFQGPDNTYLDAGPTLTMNGPNGSIELTKHSAFGKIAYQPDQSLGDLPLSLWSPDSDYEVIGEGSHLNQGVDAFDLSPAVRTPQPLELLAPDVAPGEIAVDGSTDLSLSWTPGNGDYVLVIFAVASNGVGQYLLYHVDDDGGFQVPALGISGLPSGVGSLTVERVIERPLVLPGGADGTGIGGDAITVRLVKH